MNVLSLCSGIGGLDPAMQALGGRTIGYVEINPYRQAVLHARMREGWLDSAPIWPDLRTFNGVEWRGTVDCAVAGFPCQPFSTAGLRRGADDARNLWPAVATTISDVGPTLVFLENVPGAQEYFFHQVTPDLQAMGYSTSAPIITSAAEVGAGHIRRRIYLLAHSTQSFWGQRQHSNRVKAQDNRGLLPANSPGERRDAWRTKPTVEERQPEADGLSSNSSFDSRAEESRSGFARLEGTDWWAAEPALDRVVHGLPNRVDRVRALGDAVVPQQAFLAWRLLTQ